MIIFIAAKHTKKNSIICWGHKYQKHLTSTVSSTNTVSTASGEREKARCTMDSEQRSTATELKPVEFATFILMWGTHVRTGTTAVGQCQQCHPQGTDCHPLRPTVRQHPQC